MDKVMDKVMVEKIINKLLSGRFISTIAVVGTYVYLSSMGKIPAEATLTITVMVIKDYFDRKDRANG